MSTENNLPVAPKTLQKILKPYLAFLKRVGINDKQRDNLEQALAPAKKKNKEGAEDEKENPGKNFTVEEYSDLLSQLPETTGEEGEVSTYSSNVHSILERMSSMLPKAFAEIVCQHERDSLSGLPRWEKEMHESICCYTDCLSECIKQVLSASSHKTRIEDTNKMFVCIASLNLVQTILAQIVQDFFLAQGFCKNSPIPLEEITKTPAEKQGKKPPSFKQTKTSANGSASFKLQSPPKKTEPTNQGKRSSAKVAPSDDDEDANSRRGTQIEKKARTASGAVPTKGGILHLENDGESTGSRRHKKEVTIGKTTSISTKSSSSRSKDMRKDKRYEEGYEGGSGSDKEDNQNSKKILPSRKDIFAHYVSIMGQSRTYTTVKRDLPLFANLSAAKKCKAIATLIAKRGLEIKDFGSINGCGLRNTNTQNSTQHGKNCYFCKDFYDDILSTIYDNSSLYEDEKGVWTVPKIGLIVKTRTEGRGGKLITQLTTHCPFCFRDYEEHISEVKGERAKRAGVKPGDSIYTSCTEARTFWRSILNAKEAVNAELGRDSIYNVLNKRGLAKEDILLQLGITRRSIEIIYTKTAGDARGGTKYYSIYIQSAYDNPTKTFYQQFVTGSGESDLRRIDIGRVDEDDEDRTDITMMDLTMIIGICTLYDFVKKLNDTLMPLEKTQSLKGGKSGQKLTGRKNHAAKAEFQTVFERVIKESREEFYEIQSEGTLDPDQEWLETALDPFSPNFGYLSFFFDCEKIKPDGNEDSETDTAEEWNQGTMKKLITISSITDQTRSIFRNLRRRMRKLKKDDNSAFFTDIEDEDGADADNQPLDSDITIVLHERDNIVRIGKKGAPLAVLGEGPMEKKEKKEGGDDDDGSGEEVIKARPGNRKAIRKTPDSDDEPSRKEPAQSGKKRIRRDSDIKMKPPKTKAQKTEHATSPKNSPSGGKKKATTTNTTSTTTTSTKSTKAQSETARKSESPPPKKPIPQTMTDSPKKKQQSPPPSQDPPRQLLQQLTPLRSSTGGKSPTPPTPIKPAFVVPVCNWNRTIARMLDALDEADNGERLLDLQNPGSAKKPLNAAILEYLEDKLDDSGEGNLAVLARIGAKNCSVYNQLRPNPDLVKEGKFPYQQLDHSDFMPEMAFADNLGWFIKYMLLFADVEQTNLPIYEERLEAQGVNTDTIAPNMRLIHRIQSYVDLLPLSDAQITGSEEYSKFVQQNIHRGIKMPDSKNAFLYMDEIVREWGNEGVDQEELENIVREYKDAVYPNSFLEEEDLFPIWALNHRLLAKLFICGFITISPSPVEEGFLRADHHKHNPEEGNLARSWLYGRTDIFHKCMQRMAMFYGCDEELPKKESADENYYDLSHLYMEKTHKKLAKTSQSIVETVLKVFKVKEKAEALTKKLSLPSAHINLVSAELLPNHWVPFGKVVSEMFTVLETLDSLAFRYIPPAPSSNASSPTANTEKLFPLADGVLSPNSEKSYWKIGKRKSPYEEPATVSLGEILQVESYTSAYAYHSNNDGKGPLDPFFNRIEEDECATYVSGRYNSPNDRVLAHNHHTLSNIGLTSKTLYYVQYMMKAMTKGGEEPFQHMLLDTDLDKEICFIPSPNFDLNEGPMTNRKILIKKALYPYSHITSIIGHLISGGLWLFREVVDPSIFIPVEGPSLETLWKSWKTDGKYKLPISHPWHYFPSISQYNPCYFEEHKEILLRSNNKKRSMDLPIIPPKQSAATSTATSSGAPIITDNFLQETPDSSLHGKYEDDLMEDDTLGRTRQEGGSIELPTENSRQVSFTENKQHLKQQHALLVQNLESSNLENLTNPETPILEGVTAGSNCQVLTTSGTNILREEPQDPILPVNDGTGKQEIEPQSVPSTNEPEACPPPVLPEDEVIRDNEPQDMDDFPSPPRTPRSVDEDDSQDESGYVRTRDTTPVESPRAGHISGEDVLGEKETVGAKTGDGVHEMAMLA